MEAARAEKGPILSVSAGYNDSIGESVRVHSNGFFGSRRSTRFSLWADVTIKDPDGRRPQDWYAASAHRLGDLEDPTNVGKKAAARAVARSGQIKVKSATLPLVVENRVAGHLLARFLDGMYGSALQQKRSFLAGKLGQPVGSKLLTLVDDPLLVGGFGSRHFDGDGISARRRVLVDKGVLKSYLIGVYYGRKLGMAPTGGSTSNLILPPGRKSAEELVAGIKHGIFVTTLLGGNSDSTTGDFSHGIVGFEIVDGKRGRAIGEMNITGSHSRLWTRLAEVGNDPYPYSSWRVPTVILDGVSVSGT
jgi:PmbA protein